LDNIQAVRVRGDSMNPTLREDDYVVIELEERFSGDGIYVLSWDGILLVKRLQAGNMVIKVLSDNQSFESMEYNPTEDQRTFHIIGKVILRIQR
jgi:phage repressor protein C with HTH and peptisase S24 domain